MSSVSAVGIIAEYNPFHNGHLWHLREARQKSGRDFTCVLLSGHFVQRGSAAVWSPHARAAAALSAGADAVFLMPTPFSASSARDYATFGVRLFSALGLPALSCGTEGHSAKELLLLAKSLNEADPRFRQVLKAALKRGSAYPAAREEATMELLFGGGENQTDDTWGGVDSQPAVSGDGTTSEVPVLNREAIHEMLSEPNHLLAFEYASALKTYAPHMGFFTVPRRGAGHDAPLTGRPAGGHAESGYDSGSGYDIRQGCDDWQGYDNRQGCDNRQGYASASAIRKLLLENEDSDNLLTSQSLLSDLMPPEALNALKDRPALNPEAFLLPVKLALLSCLRDDIPLSVFSDMPEDLADRITPDRIAEADSLSALIEGIRTRQYTHTRVSRALTSVLNGVRKEQMEAWKAAPPPFAYLLGFRKPAGELLSQLKRESDIPIISKAADAEHLLGAGTPAHRLFLSEVHASELWNTVLRSSCGQQEKDFYRQSPVVIP